MLTLVSTSKLFIAVCIVITCTLSHSERLCVMRMPDSYDSINSHQQQHQAGQHHLQYLLHGLPRERVASILHLYPKDYDRKLK